MMGRLDLCEAECTMCSSTGKDPKNRKRPCPKCWGTGQMSVCTNCGEVYGEGCVDTALDQTYCTKKESE